MWSRLALAGLLAVGLAASSAHAPALAQAWQCRPPASLPQPVIDQRQSGEVRRTAVDGYILALSWSREYCRGRENSARDALQCGGMMGEFGFVLHGLWPEAKGPDYPQWCRTAAPLPRKVVAQNICMTPSVQLLQHQWAKHGTCMTRRPESYFNAARILFNALEFPDMDRLSRRGEQDGTLTAAKLTEEFALTNDGLPEAAIRVKTNRRGWLEEVHICLNRKFKPRTCPTFNRGAPGNAQIRIWRGS
jgi:ribonuclease T2